MPYFNVIFCLNENLHKMNFWPYNNLLLKVCMDEQLLGYLKIYDFFKS